MLKYEILKAWGTNTDYMYCHRFPMLRYAKEDVGLSRMGSVHNPDPPPSHQRELH